MGSRIVIVSGYFPPIVGGTSTVMANLARGLDPSSFWAISETAGGHEGIHNSAVDPLWRIDRIGAPAFLRQIPYGRRLIRFWRVWLIPTICRRICRRARQIEADSILAVFPSWPFYIAAYYAHRRLKIPLYTYHMDVPPCPEELGEPDRTLSRLFNEKILRAAKTRISLSHAMQSEFKRRWGLDSVLVPHSIHLNSGDGVSLSAEFLQRSLGERLLVHTGVVEGFQRQGLLDIARVLREHPELNAKLVLSTPTPMKDLTEGGFDPQSETIVSLTPGEVAALQRTASVLIAVLPFTHRSDERTPFPTKTVEYMVSGRPILVYAPEDSFLAKHVQEHGYGLLAGSESVLLESIRKLLDDSDFGLELVKNARRTVAAQFSIEAVLPKFADACGLDPSLLRLPKVAPGR